MRSVDYHTQIPRESLCEEGVLVRNRNLVEGYKNGRVVAKAVRAHGGSAWSFCTVNFDGSNQYHVGELAPWLPELLGRKIAMTVVKELAENA